MYLFTFHTILFWLQYSLEYDRWISDDALQNFTRNGFDNLLDLLLYLTNHSRIFFSWFHLSYSLKDKKSKGFRSGERGQKWIMTSNRSESAPYSCVLLEIGQHFHRNLFLRLEECGREFLPFSLGFFLYVYFISVFLEFGYFV